MSAHRRPLVTAAAAGTVLLALWFVPSAKATPDGTAPPEPTPAHSTSAAPQQDGGGAGHGPEPQLAHTGGVETGPYLAGGLGFLGVGGALIVRSLRRQAR